MITLLLSWALAVEIQVPPAAVGETVVITVTTDGTPTPGVAVDAFDRAGLAGQTKETLGLTDSSGRTRWTPTAAGPALLRADKAETRLHVGYSGVPWPTVVPWLLIFLAGFAQWRASRSA